ncbi:bifunctional riboflavin kinase/FAD synthetase [Clostridium sp. SHJSY1]|uniref:bifunctional riboflavin kinase/FAD synthetase n=1 Tax=Clostridium sp. SHJSY1 TaxID=2942483 RepID=UPI0028743859|nr:bifunctional riboflavin kinase/FAD synthetase [Clostridium sp. SHJSY1]MDS0524883.1 bifunctional riboflavin kinase/FAD synthetase [Clostridium sp. SHJSY1]
MLSKNNDSLRKKDNINYIALGSFDGLHKGHLTLIEKLVDLVKDSKGKSIVYTFKNHPRTLINSKSVPKLLLDNFSKEEILKEKKVDLVYFEEFTEEFMKKTPEDFVKYLIEKFKIKGIVVGFNFRFGYKNMGDVKLLNELSLKYNFEVWVMKPCKFDEEVISSTRIREEISNGNLEKVSEMLTREYFLKGTVVYGRQIGRTIGFPTANLEYSKSILLPKDGVYYTNVLLKNIKYKGITSIGNNPTVNGNTITVETFILNFNGNIYGDEIKVRFIKRIRDNIKFNSINELKDQLNKDKIFAEKQKNM